MSSGVAALMSGMSVVWNCFAGVSGKTQRLVVEQPDLILAA
jgi:hypothetical protein